jgi:uncharacterized protein (DUF2141 family)
MQGRPEADQATKGVTGMTRLIGMALIVIAIATAVPMIAAAQDASALQIQVLGLRSNNGRVGCSLYNKADGFPRDESKIIKHVWAPAQNNQATCSFTGLPPGTYAVAVFHDENSNGKMDYNFIGIPKEGFGFTNDPSVTVSAPSFQSCSFSYTGAPLKEVLHIKYM